MPYERQTYSQIRADVLSDLDAVDGADPRLPASNLEVLGTAQAKLGNLHYGYLDWISKQAIPVTSTDENLEAWGALKDVIRNPAEVASGVSTHSGTTGKVVPGGTPATRGDGVAYVTVGDAVVGGGGTVAIALSAVDAGAAANADVGVAITLGIVVDGVSSTGAVTTAIAGGTDIEDQGDYLNRVLEAYRNPPQGGAAGDYETWALQVPGVTRAWAIRNGMGIGTVSVLFMEDDLRSGGGGFPVGTDGTATLETRDANATGDQLAVANYIYGPRRQPVTALVYAVAPVAAPQAFTIEHLTGASTDLKNAIAAAIADVFLRDGDPTAPEIELDAIEVAIASVPGTAGFVISVPADNITFSVGELPTVGVVSYP